jgi:hypothetical protein
MLWPRCDQQTLLPSLDVVRISNIQLPHLLGWTCIVGIIF